MGVYKLSNVEMYDTFKSVFVFITVCLSTAGFQGGHRTAEREYTAEHLEPGHAYRARVCCFSVGGQSDVSFLCHCTSSDDVVYRTDLSLCTFSAASNLCQRCCHCAAVS